MVSSESESSARVGTLGMILGLFPTLGDILRTIQKISRWGILVKTKT